MSKLNNLTPVKPKLEISQKIFYKNFSTQIPLSVALAGSRQRRSQAPPGYPRGRVPPALTFGTFPLNG